MSVRENLSTFAFVNEPLWRHTILLASLDHLVLCNLARLDLLPCGPYILLLSLLGHFSSVYVFLVLHPWYGGRVQVVVMSSSRALRSLRGTSQLVPRQALRSNVFKLSARYVTKPAYEEHIPLNWAENAFLAVGSAVMSLVDPRRGGSTVFQLNS